jgi:predicted nucleotidyltransferase
MIDPGHDETCRSGGEKSKQFGIIYAMLTPVLTHDLESVKKIVLEQLKAYKAKVYLFGSQATGKARLYSDIDIAILPLQPLPILALSEIREKLEESDIVREVDVLDLTETDDIFRQRVEKEGILWKE